MEPANVAYARFGAGREADTDARRCKFWSASSRHFSNYGGNHGRRGLSGLGRRRSHALFRELHQETKAPNSCLCHGGPELPVYPVRNVTRRFYLHYSWVPGSNDRMEQSVAMIRIAAALCFLAVALGAFGAHWLKPTLE